MKQIFATLIFSLGMICSLPAQNTPQTLPATQPDSVTVISNTADAAYEARIDSIVQAKVNKQVNKEIKKWKQRYGIERNEFPFNTLAKTQIVGIIIIISTFAFPLLIVGIVLFYRYKNKKERYEVMKQALAHGKSLPPEFCSNEITAPIATYSNDHLWRKGIKTFFLGLGLALFLGILTNSELSSIGILIMCIGGGEIILSWFPSASQVKSSYHRYRKEEKLWKEQPNSPRHNAAPQQAAVDTEETDKKDDTEGNLPETKDNLNSEGNELSRTDKEEVKG